MPLDPISSLYALVDFIDAHTLCSTLQHWVLLDMSNSRDSRYDDTEQRAALPAFSRDMSHVIQALYSLRKNKQKHTAAWSDWLVISKFSERYSYGHCRAHLFQLADAVISYEGELPVDRVDFMCYLEAFLTIAALVPIPETWLGTWMERNEPKQMAM